MDGGSSSARGSGLPRHSFVEDPFFQNSPFPQDNMSNVFDDFRNRPSRNFGSNPRLFDDYFFDNFGSSSGFGSEPSFFRSSLPRRGPPAGFDRPSVNISQPQQTTPQRSPTQPRKNPIPAEYSHMPNGQPVPPVHHQRQSSSTSHYGGGGGGNYGPQTQNNGGPGHVKVIPVHHQQTGSQQPPPPSPIYKNIVELNNADPNSYTNGQLNPDKRRRFSNNFQNGADSSQQQNEPSMKVPVVKVEDYSNKSQGDRQPSPAISEKAIPLPPPPTMSQSDSREAEGQAKTEQGRSCTTELPAGKEDTQAEKKMEVPINFVPLADTSEKLVDLLDDTERRVEMLREMASQLEQEKEAVLQILTNVKLSTEALNFEQSEQDEVHMTADRILKRCRAVDVVVNTPRNEDQKRALDEVNQLIQSVVSKMQDDVDAAKLAERFLNACCPDEPTGPIDERFQAKVVACTADDQKKIRRRLAQLTSQDERAEKMCHREGQ